MTCQISSDEYLNTCKVSQEDRKFYLLDPTAWDWKDSYKSGLYDGVRAIMLPPYTVAKPFWLKSDQQWAIFRQLKEEFWNFETQIKEADRFEKQVEEAEHGDDAAFIMFLFQAEDICRSRIEELVDHQRTRTNTPKK